MNAIMKFRKYWEDLDFDERRSMWYILTALRGPDADDSYAMKNLTTGRIRYELFGVKLAREIQGSWANVTPPKKKWPDTKHLNASSHFLGHIYSALTSFRRVKGRGITNHHDIFLMTNNCVENYPGKPIKK